MKTKIALLLLALFALGGCVTVGNAKLDNPSSYMQLHQQQSTKADVYAQFGQPQDVLPLGAGDEWVYYKVHNKPSALSFIPFVGVVAGGVRRDMTTSHFEFDEHGVLQKANVNSDSNYNNSVAGLARDLYRMHDKSPAERVKAEMTSMGKPFDEKLAKQMAAYREKE